MTNREIEEGLKKLCGDDNMFFAHDSKKILWFDKDSETWNVNTYTLAGGVLDVSPMPEETFDPAMV